MSYSEQSGPAFNVKLWLLNDQSLYSALIGWLSGMSERRLNNSQGTFYQPFIQMLRDEFELIETPDKVAYNDTGISWRGMDNFIYLFAKENEDTIKKLRKEQE